MKGQKKRHKCRPGSWGSLAATASHKEMHFPAPSHPSSQPPNDGYTLQSKFSMSHFKTAIFPATGGLSQAKFGDSQLVEPPQHRLQLSGAANKMVMRQS